MRTRQILSIAIFLLSAVTLTAAPRTFVSTESGVDTNPCSRALPCRSFAGALPATDVDGEVIVLDSGGYGIAAITQSVSLISPAGVHAGITTSVGDAIIVDAGDAANVVLRNLALTWTGMADAAGIRVQTVASLSVEGCSIAGFNTGIAFDSATPAARLYVTDSFIHRNFRFTLDGIHVSGTNLRAMIDSTRIEATINGVYVSGSQATIHDCVVVNSQNGITADAGAKVVIDKTVAKSNSYGFWSNANCVMVLSRSTVTLASLYGIAVFGTSYISASTITGNDRGVFVSSLGAAWSRGNNTLQRNTTNGSFSATYPAQ